MKTVIYHSADFDGIFCREIARRFLNHDPDCDSLEVRPDAPPKPCNCTKYIGWNFGEPKITMPAQGEVYIMDLPPDCLEDGELGQRVVWIDHHKTSIEKWTPDYGACSIPGYRIDGVAACRLAWQWFTTVDGNAKREGVEIGLPIRPAGVLPMVQHFKNREVNEPLAVRLAGEYDVWDHRGDGDLQLQFGLRSVDLNEYRWSLLLNPGQVGDDFTRELMNIGQTSMDYARNVDAGNMKASFIIEWEGLKFLCLNGRGNSNTFASRDVHETGHDALLMFYFNGKQWIVSLYHAKHRTDLDLSQIAVKHGGGGHRGACGFTCDKLPFTT